MTFASDVPNSHCKHLGFNLHSRLEHGYTAGLLIHKYIAAWAHHAYVHVHSYTYYQEYIIKEGKRVSNTRVGTV